ncbi:cell division protein FtsQ/DivIB [Salimicrobium halophilum]|uniref:Cell division protein DivIB n=1 Tax=Salimicrobium halophilum TaxID=86666 RepID=A0A1G8QHI0_9BACI|nr:FtsQ-type POTRA domain-containing protein [Salimicrobium halophilum]SDJ03540.1 cell division protein FtsQ [Salimicrobium halophilum]
MKKEKNVVSIEERIPQLKQRRKRKVNRQLILYLTILFLLIGVVIYLQSPLSNVATIEVNGEEEVAEEEIRELSGITEDNNLWSVDRNSVREALMTHPEVKDATINRSFPATVTITVDERDRVAYVEEEESYAPILENGNILDKRVDHPGGDAPVLSGFTKEENLKEMAAEISELPPSISSLISEVHWVEDEEWDKVRLYMNDGYTVLASMRYFAEKMPSYPSIVAQLNPDARGVIHIGVGTYFEPSETESGQGENEENEKSEQSEQSEDTSELEENTSEE